VGRFAVTFDEWDACVADGGCGHRAVDKGWSRGRQPVINVSWNDAKGYVAWLSKKTGKTYRLLTEAEREYVTRAGTITPFWWGSSISTSQANYDGNFIYGGPKGEYRQRTVPVDSFEPNPWGLYQVHGNVWEWVEDCWNGSYKGALPNGSARITGECDRHVVRGGSWGDDPQKLRSAFRNRLATGSRGMDLGFRVARMLAP
jgi:formylglycine-generating enzyme required for sulfatase activity